MCMRCNRRERNRSSNANMDINIWYHSKEKIQDVVQLNGKFLCILYDDALRGRFFSNPVFRILVVPVNFFCFSSRKIFGIPIPFSFFTFEEKYCRHTVASRGITFL